ncbi:MAG: MFS transporter, partial [Alphaproteobacteria bacterium]|nr:MFS transporter [Alphaproteobacteria bacterium]
GAGFGTCNGYLNLSMMEAASDAERDRTSALVPTTQSAGGAIGAALAGVAANGAGLASATAPHDVIAAMVPLYALGFVVAAMALAAAWHMVGLMQQAEGQDATVAA